MTTGGSDLRYAAVGDSFTEGVGDELADGSVRGWADLVAAGLAGRSVRYANLAVRGRLLAPIVDEQVPAALALDPAPTLLTLNGGGNDVLRPGVEVATLGRLTERGVRQAREAGVRTVLVSGADPTGGLPFGRTIHRRAAELTAVVAEVAQRCDVTFVDAFSDLELRRPDYWSPDRLHLGPDGHRRVAGLVLAALGHESAAHALDPSPARPRPMTSEMRYWREHVLPWLGRRVRRRSSGDGQGGKNPNWVQLR